MYYFVRLKYFIIYVLFCFTLLLHTIFEEQEIAT